MIGSETMEVINMQFFLDIGISENTMWAIIACIVMMLMDVASGFVAAWKNKEIDSTKIREGLFHKANLIMIIVLAWLCEVFIMHVPELGISVPLVIPSCIIIFAMEIVSITENAAKIDPKLKNSKLLQLFKEGKETNA